MKKPTQVLSSTRGNVAEKLVPKFAGPFVVVEVIPPNVQQYRNAEEESEDPGDPHELARQVQFDRELLEINNSDSEEETDEVQEVEID